MFLCKERTRFLLKNSKFVFGAKLKKKKDLNLYVKEFRSVL